MGILAYAVYKFETRKVIEPAVEPTTDYSQELAKELLKFYTPSAPQQIKLPEMSGYEMLQAFKAGLSAIPGGGFIYPAAQQLTQQATKVLQKPGVMEGIVQAAKTNYLTAPAYYAAQAVTKQLDKPQKEVQRIDVMDKPVIIKIKEKLSIPLSSSAPKKSSSSSKTLKKPDKKIPVIDLGQRVKERTLSKEQIEAYSRLAKMKI